MRLGTCIPCQFGNHDAHHEVMQAVPEGVMGGAICTCKGECRENASEQRKRMLRRMGLAHTPPSEGQQ